MFSVISDLVTTWNKIDILTKPTTDDTNQYHWLGITTFWSNKHKEKKLQRGKYLFRGEVSNESRPQAEGCNHFELLIYSNLNLTIKELILFLKSIFSIRCANKQNISAFISIKNTIKHIKTTGKSKLLMLVAVFSSRSIQLHKKTQTFRYKKIVSLSDVLESHLQSSSITYSHRHIKTGSCGHHSLQGFTFCWIYRNKYSTLQEPSTPEQAFKKVIQKFFYCTTQLVLRILTEKNANT